MFANFVLADEINRAPAKVQSALLEVMAERQVSIGGVDLPGARRRSSCSPPRTRSSPRASTRCPRRSATASYEGRSSTTRPPTEELEIVYRMGVEPAASPSTVLGPDDAAPAAADGRRRSSSHHALVDYAVRLVLATRDAARARPGRPRHAGSSYGASPRASLGLIAAGRALALLRGRDYVLPQDVFDVAADVLRHRLVLSYDALADGVPADHIVKRIVQTVPLPQVAPRQNAGGFGPGTPGGPHVPQFGPPQPAPRSPGSSATPASDGHAHGPHPA